MDLKITTFKITKMDCPSEEQMIRMKLEGIESIKQLNFDIPNRKLDVIHTNDTSTFEGAVHALNFDSTLLTTKEFKGEIKKSNNDQERKMLWWVLAINFAFFVVEMLYGWLSNSMGLIADSLDMLADSIVYGMSLLAVGAVISKKKNIAKLSGYFQMLLALIGLIEVVRRFIGTEAMPLFENMIVISFLALIANSVSLYLIQKVKSEEAHMKASAIFTSNDIIINIGVIVAGGLVHFTNSRYPDLVIGSLIFGIVIQGAIRILKLAK